MKLSKAQVQHIEDERAKIRQRIKDLDTFGDSIYKSPELCGERSALRYDLWFFNHMIKLHNVELAAEKESQKELEKQSDEEFLYSIR